MDRERITCGGSNAANRLTCLEKIHKTGSRAALFVTIETEYAMGAVLRFPGERSPQAVTRQARAIAGRSARGRVTGKLAAAITVMVWEGSCRAEAAKAAGLKDHSLREALRKPHVKAFYRAQLDVLRTSEWARNVHALARIRDQDQNKTAVIAAVKALEEMGDGGPGKN